MAPTIGSKLYGLATLAVAAILVTAVGAAWSPTRMSDQIAAAAPRVAALEAVGSARTGVLEIVLASAMSEARRGVTEVVERVTAVTVSAQETDEASSGVAAAGRTLAVTAGSLRNTVRKVATDLRRDASAS